MQVVLEVSQSLRVSEDLAAELPAVHAPFAPDVVPESLDDAGDSRPVLREEVVDDLVGGDGLGAELAEKTDESALT